MKGDQAPRPRIIVKKGHGGPHGGAWKVAYADFVTTMMALFIVLWITSQNAGTREAVAQYFKDPGTFKVKSSPSMIPGSTGLLPGQPVEGPGDGNDPAAEERALQKAAEQFRDALEHSGISEALQGQVRIEVTREGLRIELIERDNSPFFLVGSPAVLPSLRPVLENLVRVVAKLPNPITIEGHTDSRRYNTSEGYSNWELSTDRTNSARRVMDAAGLTPGRIDRIVGHADRMPLLPDDPLNAMNRRITIVVRRQGPGPDAKLDALPKILAPSGTPRS
jgi:chemotaxis protein MotB